MFLDEKIILEQGTTDRYGIAVLNPDGSTVGGGSTTTTLYTMINAYDSNDNIEYIGEALAGNLTNTSSAIWRIKKLVYDVNENITSVAWADGNTNFDNIWNNRASLTYS